MKSNKTVAIGADHAGFDLKEAIKIHLAEKGLRVQDLGCASRDSVDYPDYARDVAQAVASQKAAWGVLVCNTGIGMSMAANKVKGVRAALVHDAHAARMSRCHNDANVLVLGAAVTKAGEIPDILRGWLEAAFEGGRHSRRVDKIKDLEKS